MQHEPGDLLQRSHVSPENSKIDCLRPGSSERPRVRYVCVQREHHGTSKNAGSRALLAGRQRRMASIVADEGLGRPITK